MCGIIGYVGSRRASRIITDGLKRLEYRGYDSVGIAVLERNTAEIRKDKGMVEEVSSALDFAGIGGNIGLGHTRWATHGAVCRENAHPHTDCTRGIILAHNGVIENFPKLREELASSGHKFASDTDSEAIAHLIEESAKSQPLLKAFIRSIGRLEGSYAIVAMSANDVEERLFLARRNSPLVIGVGRGEMFCASDIPAMLTHTRTFVPLQEGDLAVISRNGYKIYSLDGSEVTRKQITVDWSMDLAQKGGYSHFMQKEIMDQKHFINESLSSETEEARALLEKAGRIDIIAAGTSYHAGLMLAYLLQGEGGAGIRRERLSVHRQAGQEDAGRRNKPERGDCRRAAGHALCQRVEKASPHEHRRLDNHYAGRFGGVPERRPGGGSRRHQDIYGPARRHLQAGFPKGEAFGHTGPHLGDAR